MTLAKHQTFRKNVFPLRIEHSHLKESNKPYVSFLDNYFWENTIISLSLIIHGTHNVLYCTSCNDHERRRW